MFQNIWRDVRYGLRSLRRSPSFSAVAVVSLAVGIGANTAMFSVANSLLWRPLAAHNPEELVQIYSGERRAPYEGMSHPSYLDVRDRTQEFTGLASYGMRQFKIGEASDVELIWGEAVSSNYFDVLGVPPRAGQPFPSNDDRVPGSSPAVVISSGLWQRRFQSDPAVVGRTVHINHQPLTIVGVAPPEFTGMMRGIASDVWVPSVMLPVLERDRSIVTERGSRWLVLIGRLRPGVSVDQAKTRFDVLTRELQASHPEEWRSPQEPTGAIRELFLTVVPERDTRIPPGMQADANVAAALVFAIVNVILVIACVNMAGMLLARAVSRRKEIAVRLALGASRFRLIRQLVTESVLLSLIAGAVGGLVTIWALGLVVAFMPPLPEGIRIALDFAPDWRVFAYTIAFSLLTGVLFGLAPALVGSRADVSPGLKDDAGGVTGGYRRSRTRSLLVVAQVALSVLMLISAGLSLRSLSNLRPTALGFSTDSMLVVPVTLDEKYDRQSSQNFYRQLSDRVRALPGVQHVSLVEALQGGFLGKARRGTEVEGYTGADAQSLAIDHAFVGPRYFTNMNVPIVSGRDIDDRDREGTPCVAVINEVFARRYFPNERSPLGKHLAKLTRGPKELCAIVGVINDERFQALEETPQPFFAFSIFQTHRLTMSLLVNTGPAPAAFVEPVAKIVRDLDPMLTVQDIRTLADTFGAALYPFQLLALVLAGCGATALLLATIGVYGIVSYSVAQRTREVGIRVALGAVKTDVLKMIVGQGMTVVAAGLAIGLVLSAGLMQVLGSELLETGFLFGVSATDFATFASVTLLLALVSGLACYLPARRAMRIDPIKALKYE